MKIWSNISFLKSCSLHLRIYSAWDVFSCLAGSKKSHRISLRRSGCYHSTIEGMVKIVHIERNPSSDISQALQRWADPFLGSFGPLSQFPPEHQGSPHMSAVTSCVLISHLPRTSWLLCTLYSSLLISNDLVSFVKSPIENWLECKDGNWHLRALSLLHLDAGLVSSPDTARAAWSLPPSRTRPIALPAPRQAGATGQPGSSSGVVCGTSGHNLSSHTMLPLAWCPPGQETTALPSHPLSTCSRQEMWARNTLCGLRLPGMGPWKPGGQLSGILQAGVIHVVCLKSAVMGKFKWQKSANAVVYTFPPWKWGFYL